MVAAALAVPARAAPAPIQYIQQYVYAATQQGFALGTVACPAGTFVVSASATHTTNLTSLTPLRGLRTSQDLANFTAVAATGRPYADQPGGARYMTLQAACAPASRLVNAVSRSITVSPVLPTPDFSLLRGVVRCPAGMRAFGGGAYFLASDNHISIAGAAMYENSVTPDGAGWAFRGVTSAKTDRLIVTTQCAILTGSFNVQPVGTPAPAPAFADAAARCLFGYTVLSGGVTFARADNREGEGIVSTLWTSAGGVQVRGYSFNAGVLLTARAQCVPPDSF
jgi:hypothetical protein